MGIKCFYHSSDLDGHCSGALVKYFFKNAELYPINYGDKFPWDNIFKFDNVYMVDFSLQPHTDMLRLSQSCFLIWIDHHITAIDALKSAKIAGLRDNTNAACELVWKYLSREPIPKIVRLLGRYDVWDHSDPEVLPFQYGMKLYNTDPLYNMDLWNVCLSSFPDYMLKEGRTVLKYEEQYSRKYCATAFETELEGFKCIAVNRLMCNSKSFESVWDSNKYDFMITFGFANDKWLISLYTDREDINIGDIAKKLGGGGHKQAAGFNTTKLPFKLPKKDK